MNAGRELDALVAEKVFGHAVHVDPEFGAMLVIDGQTDFSIEYAIPFYSTDIAAAWEVVEHFDARARKLGVMSGGIELQEWWAFRLQLAHNYLWDAQFDFYREDNSVGTSVEEYFAQADIAPHAICLAALQAVAG